jgi:hypothetical protein
VDEKKRIEASTADAFLSHYNQQEGTSYRVVKRDKRDVAPDIRARDERGEILQFDVVQTEDRPGDIKAALGRSESRSLEALEQHVEEVRTGKADPRDRASKLSRNVIDRLKNRLRKKLKMRYGTNTALVIRDTSGVDWDWNLVKSFQEIVGSVLKELKVENPYDRGIWLISRSKDRVFHIL